MQVTVDRVQQTGCFVVSYRPATQWRSASARSSPRAPGPACVGHDVVNLPSPPRGWLRCDAIGNGSSIRVQSSALGGQE